MVNADPRLWGRGSDFAEVKIDPKNKDLVYVANVGLYKSTDGGKTFTCFKGAPGGDNFHTVWISPEDSNRILVAADQGAIVTVTRLRPGWREVTRFPRSTATRRAGRSCCRAPTPSG
ncbi:hypothetical protein BH11PLA2_BH11PLA2_50350 [soil metagenome]